MDGNSGERAPQKNRTVVERKSDLELVVTRVFGNDATVAFANTQGHFQLNVYKPVIAYATLQSIRLLADAAVSFTDNCVVGIRANTVPGVFSVKNEIQVAGREH